MRITLIAVLLAVPVLGACASQRGAGDLGVAAAEPATRPEPIALTGPHPDLPAPDTAHSATHFSKLVPWPAGRTPQAPPGFAVSLYASGLQRPRWLYVLPNGDVLVAESASSASGRDTLLSPGELAGQADHHH
jgi:glucose/arabinose dehydrogenase